MLDMETSVCSEPCQDLHQRRARVLLVSFSNACRTQMAEAFARATGEDSMLAFSAGIRPAGMIAGVVHEVMQENGSPLSRDQHPRNLSSLDLSCFDLIVNLSGVDAAGEFSSDSGTASSLPNSRDLESHRAVRDRMEALVSNSWWPIADVPRNGTRAESPT